MSGRRGGTMPPYTEKLLPDEQDLADIHAYLRARSGPAPVSVLPPPLSGQARHPDRGSRGLALELIDMPVAQTAERVGFKRKEPSCVLWC